MTVALLVPDRSLEQRMSALQRANDVRTRRAKMKRQITGRVVTWDVALVRGDCRTMKVWDLLLVVPKIGRVKANRILRQCEISPSKTVGGLTDRQKQALLEHVGR